MARRTIPVAFETPSHRAVLRLGVCHTLRGTVQTGLQQWKSSPVSFPALPCAGKLSEVCPYRSLVFFRCHQNSVSIVFSFELVKSACTVGKSDAHSLCAVCDQEMRVGEDDRPVQGTERAAGGSAMSRTMTGGN